MKVAEQEETTDRKSHKEEDSLPLPINLNGLTTGHGDRAAERGTEPTRRPGVNSGHAQVTFIGAETTCDAPAAATPARRPIHHEERQKQPRN